MGWPAILVEPPLLFLCHSSSATPQFSSHFTSAADTLDTLLLPNSFPTACLSAPHISYSHYHTAWKLKNISIHFRMNRITMERQTYVKQVSTHTLPSSWSNRQVTPRKRHWLHSHCGLRWHLHGVTSWITLHKGQWPALHFPFMQKVALKSNKL